jgi:hypothetical protein
MQDSISEQSKQKIFDAGMDRLSRAFDVAVKPERLAVYWESLKGYSEAKLDSALKQALENERFFPSIAAIRQYVEPLKQGPMGRVTPVVER